MRDQANPIGSLVDAPPVAGTRQQERHGPLCCLRRVDQIEHALVRLHVAEQQHRERVGLHAQPSARFVGWRRGRIFAQVARMRQPTDSVGWQREVHQFGGAAIHDVDSVGAIRDLLLQPGILSRVPRVVGSGVVHCPDHTRPARPGAVER